MSGHGFHILLNREDSKKLFAQREPVAIRDFAAELTKSSDYRKQGRLLELGETWSTLHRCLTDGTLDPAGGDPPLNHCFLGGRMLYQGEGMFVTLVRPDMTPYVAEALAEVKHEHLLKNYDLIDANDYGRPLSPKDFEKAWVVFQQIRDFYDFAARDLSAMLFVGLK
ncbi:MAG: DUF1877 family protein [Planctomycetota bacterium]